MQTLIDHLLDRARRVDLHRKEVVKAVYFCRFFRELLPECIREVVCGIGRLCVRCAVTFVFVRWEWGRLRIEKDYAR